MLLTRLITYIILLSITGSVYSQNNIAIPPCDLQIRGMVLDGETNKPVHFALVIIKSIDKNASTNINGEFVFENICKGKYTVEVLLMGYKSFSSVMNFSQNAFHTFVLHADTCLMESVVITGIRQERELTQSQVTLEGKTLDQTRGLSIGESLKALPGVNALQTGPSIFKPIIQGMYGNRVLMMNNGVRQEGQQWGSEHAPEIDPFVASKISVIKGASGVRYGSDAMGGVILVDPKELRNTNGVGGEINMVGLSNNRQGVASGLIDFHSDKLLGLSGRIQGTIKQAGNSRTPDYYLSNTGFKEYNFSTALGYQKKDFKIDFFYSQFNTSLGIYAFSHIGNLTDLKAAIDLEKPLETSGFSYNIDRPKQVVSHELSKIRSSYKINSIGTIELVLARQFNYRAEYDKHLPKKNDLKEKPQSEFGITTYTGNLVLEQKKIKNISGSIGLNIITQGNTTSGTVRSFIPNFRSYAGGGFIIERWKRNRLELEGGLRYDYKWMKIYKYEDDVIISPEFRFANFSGSVGAIYDINHQLKWRTNVGSCFRPPAVNELFSDGLHHGSSRIETGDRTLRPEISYSLNTTLSINTRKFYGEIAAYANYISNYIYLTPELKYDSTSQKFVPVYRLLIRGAYPSFVYKQVDAIFTGVDVALYDSLTKKILIDIKISLLNAYNTQSGNQVVLTPSANALAGVSYFLPSIKNIKNPYIKISGFWNARRKGISENEDFKVPPPAYFLYHLEGGLSFYLGKQRMDISLAVNNILNTRYRDYLDRFRYFNDAIGRNFVIRLKVPFELSR